VQGPEFYTNQGGQLRQLQTHDEKAEEPMGHNLIASAIVDQARGLFAQLADIDGPDLVDAVNEIRTALHEASPFASEPVDCVLWIEADRVRANDYNPNAVAPPEMRLLERSIKADGYTQPIVAWETGECVEVVDGFHRNRVGKESKAIRKRTNGYLPIALINPDREGKGDRIAATIRHNRARGKHQVEAMSEIVRDLARRNWSAKRIGKELGMEPDEVLRLKQITGLAEMFADREFSEAWEAE
jgi:ParB-like chromosome segregation protein Spo0J